jgi:hypothetical protein
MAAGLTITRNITFQKEVPHQFNRVFCALFAGQTHSG